MDALHENIAVYTHSGSAPCVQAARGERVAGIALDMRGASEKTKGAPLEVIIPSEGTGWEMEASGIVKGTKNLAVAKKIADWVATKAANELYLQDLRGRGDAGRRELCRRTIRPTAEKLMIKNDFVWMAENRETHPRRVDQALRVQGRAEVTERARTGAASPRRVPSDPAAGLAQPWASA